MVIKSSKRTPEQIYEIALRSRPDPIDPYLQSGMGDVGDMGNLGDPISDFVGDFKGQITDLRLAVTVAAATSTAAAIGVVLLLLTMQGGKRR